MNSYPPLPVTAKLRLLSALLQFSQLVVSSDLIFITVAVRLYPPDSRPCHGELNVKRRPLITKKNVY
jgi:hypothetical protein